VGEAPDDYATTPPPWVCEVLSPSSREYDRSLKLSRYREHKIGHVWIVDPHLHQIEVFPGVPLTSWRVVRESNITLPPFDAALDLATLGR
jgi:Uma2 family endonuclease